MLRKGRFRLYELEHIRLIDWQNIFHVVLVILPERGFARSPRSLRYADFPYLKERNQL